MIPFALMSQLAVPLSVAPAAPVVPNHRRLTIAVVLAGFCTFLQVYVTQPLLPEFRRIFAASEFHVSLTVSAVTLAVALASPFVGAVADMVGRKRIIVPAILGLAVPTALSATSHSLDQLIAWRFVQGLFVPGIIAVTVAYIAEEAPAGMAGSITAAYVTGTVLGGLVGRLLTALCADSLGWRFTFVLLAALTLASGLLVWRWLPRSTRFRRSRHPIKTIFAMAQHMGNARLLATYFVGFNVLFCLVGVFTYVNFYLAGDLFHLSTAALGMVFLVYALGVFVTPASGSLIDRIGHRKALVWAVVITAIGALLTLLHWLPAVILGLAVFSTGVFICQSAASSHVALSATHARSAATGLYSSFYYLGGSAGAALMGIAWKHGHWPACIALVLCVQAIAATVAARYFTRAAPWSAAALAPLA